MEPPTFSYATFGFGVIQFLLKVLRWGAHKRGKTLCLKSRTVCPKTHYRVSDTISRAIANDSAVSSALGYDAADAACSVRVRISAAAARA